MGKFDPKITGVVSCSCGGQIISNSGKVMIRSDNGKFILACWRCGKEYDADYAYSFRKDGEFITIPEAPHA